MNECLQDDNAGCEQGCINNQGGFECFCGNGYTLDENGQTCSGKGIMHHLIIIIIIIRFICSLQSGDWILTDVFVHVKNDKSYIKTKWNY